MLYKHTAKSYLQRIPFCIWVESYSIILVSFLQKSQFWLCIKTSSTVILCKFILVPNLLIYIFLLQIKCDGLLDWILVGSLGLSLVMSFILIPLQGFKFTRLYSIILVSYYVMFVIIALLTEAEIIHI